MTASDRTRMPERRLADDPACATRLAARSGRPSRACVGWLSHGRSQGDRHALPRHRLRLPAARRPRGAGHARCSSRGPNQHAADAGAIQPAVLDARHDDDLPVRAAGAVGLQQLPLAAAARLARHGVPAAERALLLDLSSPPACSCMRASRSAPAPNDGWFNYVPYAARALQSRASTSISMRSGMILLGISTTVGAINFIVTLPAHARAGHVDQPRADPDLGHADRVGRQPARRCRRSASPSSCCGWTASSARISSTSPAAASRCCGSTCSGCSAIPGSTRSCCRRWAWSRTACRCSAAARWSATRRWRWRRSRPWCSASACGCTTCSRPACRRWRCRSSARASIIIADPERGRGVRLDRDDLDRPAGVHHRRSCSSPASSCCS